MQNAFRRSQYDGATGSRSGGKLQERPREEGLRLGRRQAFPLASARSKKKYKLSWSRTALTTEANTFKNKNAAAKDEEANRKLIEEEKYKRPQEKPHEFKEKPDLKIFKLYD